MAVTIVGYTVRPVTSLGVPMNPNPETALQAAILKTRRLVEPRETFWASSMGMCFRKQLCERAGLPPTHPPDQRALIKMTMGTEIGKWLQTCWLSEGYLEPGWSEERLVYRSVSGRPDGYTKTVEGGAIVEVKTVDDDSITKYKDIPEHYLWQGFTYCLAKNVPNLMIVMLGRSQGLMKHRVYALDQEWRDKIDQHITNLEGLWKIYTSIKVLPQHDHDRFKWQDRYCAYKDDDYVEELAGGTT